MSPKGSISQWIKSLTQISEMILMDENLDVTTDMILDVLNKHLEAFAAIYLKVDSENQVLKLHTFTRNGMVDKVLKAIPFDVYGVDYPLNDPSRETLIARCIQDNCVVQGPSLESFFYPVFKPRTLLRKLQKIIDLKACVAAPVRIKGEPVGAFFVVSKKSRFTEDELELLQFYANMSGITMESHNQMAQLQHKYETERETTSLLSHEIKTPIAIAYNSTHMLKVLLRQYRQQYGGDFKELQEIEENLRHQLEQLKQLCTSILSLRETENHIFLEKQALKLDRSLPHLIKNFKRVAKRKKIRLHSSFDLHDGELYGPGVQFEEILTIILDNAVKYTDRGHVDVNVQLTDEFLSCRVTDTGRGLSPEEKLKVFDLYYQASNKDRQHGGLGVGLYIAKKFVDAIGGEISIANNPSGKGTEFFVSLPVSQSTVPMPSEAKMRSTSRL